MQMQFNAFGAKKDVKIVVTDSGLGGMSVLAGIENKLRIGSEYKSAELVYFNSLPETDRGYNSMPSAVVKARVFNEALTAMAAKTSPDIILIACNTLSVVYHLTEFSYNPPVPVLGIVDFGVDRIMSSVTRNQDEIILLGTKTTIDSGEHKKRLIERGVEPERIISQACPGLESEITASPGSEKVKEMVDHFARNAVSDLKHDGAGITAALCCTHYGYVYDEFVNAFARVTQRKAEIVNPNTAMIEYISKGNGSEEVVSTPLTVRVLSRAFIPENERRSIAALIDPYAPLSASALLNYVRDYALFNYDAGIS